MGWHREQALVGGNFSVLAAAVFGKILSKLESGAVKRAVREGKLRCPECGEAGPQSPENADELLDCRLCGAENPASDWADQKRGWADRPLRRFDAFRWTAV